MQWLLQYEANAASAAQPDLSPGDMGPRRRYRITYPDRRSTLSQREHAEVQTLTYSRNLECMDQDSVRCERRWRKASRRSGRRICEFPDLPGDLGLTAQFIGVVAPAQAILSGTSSFRLDKLAAYLSSDGPQRYFERTLTRRELEARFEAIRRCSPEEILGVYPPSRCEVLTTTAVSDGRIRGGGESGEGRSILFVFCAANRADSGERCWRSGVLPGESRSSRETSA